VALVIGFMVVAGCLALGAVQLLRLALPPRVDHVRVAARWHDERARATRVRDADGRASGSLLDRLALRVAEQIERRSGDLTTLNQDLTICGTTLERHLSHLLGLVLAAFLGPPAIFTVLLAAGLALPVSWGLLLGLALAAAMVAVAHRELRAKATALRSEFRRSLSTYLDLVAMALDAGRGHAEALPAAANIGAGWTFQHLQDAIDGARFSGVTAWESLGVLGHRIGVPELVDLDAALRLANEDGAKVKATLTARAGTLRSARIADAEARANQATESMKLALIVMVFAFLGYELYPSIVRLFAG
jgi:tight adherence protein C